MLYVRDWGSIIQRLGVVKGSVGCELVKVWFWRSVIDVSVLGCLVETED